MRWLLGGLAAGTLALCVGCGDDVGFSDTATGSGGNASTSTASGTGGTSSAGGMGSGGTSDGGTSSAGGAGGGVGAGGFGAGPLCPAPTCPTSGTVVNCDPACGALHSTCADVCSVPPASSPALSLGETTIQLPPIAQASAACPAGWCSSGDLFGMFLKMPPLPHCLTIDGPAAVQFTTFGVPDGSPPPFPPCDIGLSPAQCWTATQSLPDGFTSWLWLGVAADATPLPDAGGVVTVTVATTCPPPNCNNGCNGVGGVAELPM